MRSVFRQWKQIQIQWRCMPRVACLRGNKEIIWSRSGGEVGECGCGWAAVTPLPSPHLLAKGWVKVGDLALFLWSYPTSVSVERFWKICFRPLSYFSKPNKCSHLQLFQFKLILSSTHPPLGVKNSAFDWDFPKRCHILL